MEQNVTVEEGKTVPKPEERGIKELYKAEVSIWIAEKCPTTLFIDTPLGLISIDLPLDQHFQKREVYVSNKMLESLKRCL